MFCRQVLVLCGTQKPQQRSPHHVVQWWRKCYCLLIDSELLVETDGIKLAWKFQHDRVVSGKWSLPYQQPEHWCQSESSILE